MWLNFSNPTINNLHDQSFEPAEYALITENHRKDDWVYLIIQENGTEQQRNERRRGFFAVAHPIHLHGHDFAILAQENRVFNESDITNGTFRYNNPPRRDVALLPAGGYLAIAFKTDNPGIWILHCHIAWHASSGLALQIRERNAEVRLSKEAAHNNKQMCHDWDEWFNMKKPDGTGHLHWFNQEEFQEDSGV